MESNPAAAPAFSISLLVTFGAAVVPVLFAYGGWQTASFMTGEMKDPKRDLARAVLWGVIGVTAIYLSVNYICLRVLGPRGLAATMTPAFTVMQAAIGPRGATFMATAIAVSTLGFLSQGMLTAPRVFFAMARDGLFFSQIAWVPKSTRVPVAAIALQGVMASIVALSGKYEQILNYVVSIDFIFFGTDGCIVVCVSEAAAAGDGASDARASCSRPLFFIAACWLVVMATFYHYPGEQFGGTWGFCCWGFRHTGFFRRRRSGWQVETSVRTMRSAYMEWVKTQTGGEVQSGEQRRAQLCAQRFGR